jgi:hypothetical protein
MGLKKIVCILEYFYNTGGCWFIARGDNNAKQTNWGSRLITARGHELLKMMERNNYLQENPHTGHLIGINYLI